MVVFQRKSHQRASALSLALGRLSAVEASSLSAFASAAIHADDATLFHGALDPAAGDLDEARAARKRQQLRSVASHALGLLDDGMHCVEV